MKFIADVIVHQNDSVAPDYLHLHNLLAEAGFLQRALDGTRTQQPSSCLYMREETVLKRSDVEFDLRFVLDNFPCRCSFYLHQVEETACFILTSMPTEHAKVSIPPIFFH